MLDAFFETYTSIKAAIDETHDKISVGVAAISDALSRERVTPNTTRISNRRGLNRSFELALRLVDRLMRLGEDGRLDSDMPELSAIRQCYEYRDKFWPPKAIVRSQIGGAARNLQNYCHRQAFNFKIQSLGAAYIKMLQARIAWDQIGRGVHTANNLPILPGINVHDELHFHAKSLEAVEMVKASTATFVGNVSQELGVPIVFEFSEVKSWAEKA